MRNSIAILLLLTACSGYQANQSASSGEVGYATPIDTPPEYLGKFQTPKISPSMIQGTRDLDDNALISVLQGAWVSGCQQRTVTKYVFNGRKVSRRYWMFDDEECRVHLAVPERPGYWQDFDIQYGYATANSDFRLYLVGTGEFVPPNELLTGRMDGTHFTARETFPFMSPVDSEEIVLTKQSSL